jgi:hypothetical protein
MSASTCHAALSVPKIICRGYLAMQRKKPNLAVLVDRIATARRIIEAQQALLERLRVGGKPTFEADAALRTYTSALAHLLAHADRMQQKALAKKGETKKEHRSCALTSWRPPSPNLHERQPKRA